MFENFPKVRPDLPDNYYVWLGEYDKATPLLVSIPEARTELGIYVWWWQAQGYPELSERAHAIYQRLAP